MSKPHKSYEEQLAILESRGLAVDNRDKALHALAHHSYYRLSAYRFPLQTGTDQFRPSCRFEDLLGLYFFDHRLRLLVGEACKVFEISLRARWAHVLAGEMGGQAYEDPKLFRDPQRHTSYLHSLDRELSRSKEVFVSHFRKKYGMARPPIWAVSEIMSFGLLSRFVGDLAVDRLRKAIGKTYVFSGSGLESLAQHAVYLRNLCAHHSRLWNREFTITVQLPKKQPMSVVKSLHPEQDRRIYNSLVLLAHTFSIIEPESDWLRRLKKHLATLPAEFLPAMGFPADWHERPIWKHAL